MLSNKKVMNSTLVCILGSAALIGFLVFFPWWSNLWNATLALTVMPHDFVWSLGIKLFLFCFGFLLTCSLCLIWKQEKEKKISKIYFTALCVLFIYSFFSLFFMVFKEYTPLSKYENVSSFGLDKNTELSYEFVLNQNFNEIKQKDGPQMSYFYNRNPEALQHSFKTSKRYEDVFQSALVSKIFLEWLNKKQSFFRSYPACQSIQKEFLKDTMAHSKLEMTVNGTPVKNTLLPCRVLSFNEFKIYFKAL